MSESVGRWIELQVSWHDTSVRNCSVCGRLITRRVWSFREADRLLEVCEPSCQELYETYWKPTYGCLEAATRPSR